MIAQDWFRDKFQSIYTIVINNFQEPTETPEHNAMQGDFIDDDFCIRFYYLTFPTLVAKRTQRQKKEKIDDKTISYIVTSEPNDPYIWEKNFEKGGIDVSYQLAIEYEFIKEAWDDKTKYFIRDTEDLDTTYYTRELKIEIKPTVGDDYPTVLRQMQALGVNCLYLNQYTGKGVTEEMFKKIFEQQNIVVIYESQIKSQTPQ